jgi:haloalkane dehalogenase
MNRRNFVSTAALVLALGTQRSSFARQDSEALAAQRFVAARRYASTAYADIAYTDHGTGAAALFLHGFPLNGFQWRGAIERLSPHRRCLAPDFMGLGYTQVAPSQRVTPAAQVEMLAAFLDSCSVTSVDIVANDSGGAIAQLFMARYPECVRSVLLTNCDTEPDSPPAAVLPVIELAQAGTYADKWLVPWVNDKALARSSQGLGGMCYAKPGQLTDASIDTYLGPLVKSAHRKALVNAYAMGLAPNPLAGLEAQLQSHYIPARIVWGMRDTIFSHDSPGYLDRVLPGSWGVRRIAEAKLFFPEEYPDVIAEESLSLWRKAA